MQAALPPSSSYHAAMFEALATARGVAPTPADPPWFAQAGYSAAAGDRGSAHLVWGRVAAEYRRVTRRTKGADAPACAFAMGFGLGLVDVGCVSLADGESLHEVVIKGADRASRRGDNTLVSVCIVMLLVVTIGVAFGVDRLRPEVASAGEVPSTLAPDLLPIPTTPPPVAAAPTPGWREAPEAFATRPAPVVAAGVPAWSRDAVLQGLPQSPQHQATELARRLDKLTASQRQQVLEAAATGPRSVLEAVVVYCLDTSDVEVVMAAGDQLALLGGEAAVTRLIPLLRHRVAPVRQHAAKLLSMVATADTAWPLVPLVRDSDARVSAAARGVLRRVVGSDHGKDLKRWWSAIRSALKRANVRKRR